MSALDTCLGVAQANNVRHRRVPDANETVGPARRGAALRAADWLSLAAAPTFATMALLAGVSGSGPADMLCAATREASPLSGMVPMYALMSAFHAAPWLKLISARLLPPPPLAGEGAPATCYEFASKARRSTTASEVVPGRREAASPEPITTTGSMDSALACCARAPE